MTKIRPKDLEGGSQNPGNGKYYGTDELGQIGMHQVPGSISGLGTKTLAVYGENIAAGKEAFFGKGDYIDTEKVDVINNLVGSGNVNVGHTTSIRAQQPFYVGKFNVLKKLSVQALKVGGPTDTFSVQIYDTDRTTLIATTITSLLGGSMTTGMLTYDFLFNNIQLQSYKTYYMEFRRSGSADGANYYAVSYNSTNQGQERNRRGSPETYNGTVWTRFANSDEAVVRYTLQFGMLCEAGKVYLCNSDFINKSACECVTEEAKLATETGLVTVAGINTMFSKLIKGKRYNLNNYTLGGEQRLYATSVVFGYATTDNEKVAQYFQLSRTTTITKIMLSVWKGGTPTDDVIVRIETNNPITNEPTGTLANANSTFTIPYHRLYAYHYANIWDFNGEFDLIGGETYHIVLTRSGAVSTANYYSVAIHNANVYGRGFLKEYENAAWTSQPTYDMFFDFLTNVQSAGQFSGNANVMHIGYDADTHNIHAQSFVVQKPTPIDSILLRLQKMGAPTQGVRVRIESNAKLDIGLSTNLYSNPTGSARKSFGDGTTKKLAMKFKGVGDISARFLSLYVQKVLAPIDSISVRIETDSAGAPSGVLAHAGATSTFDCTQYAASAAFYAQCEFTSQIALLGGIDYWIVVSRTGSDSAANYFQLNYQDSVYANGAISTSADGIIWIVTVNDLVFRFSNSYYEGGYDPSGALVDPAATAVVSAASIATTYNRMYKFQFSSSITLMPNTVYWIVVEPENKFDNTTNYYQRWGYNTVVPTNWYKYQDKQSRWKSVNNNRRFWFAIQNRFEADEGLVALNPGTYYGKSILAVSDVNGLIDSAGNGRNSIQGTIAASTTFSFTAAYDGIMCLTGAGVNTTTLTIREYLEPTQITETENFDLTIGAIALTSTYMFPVVAGRTYKIVTPVTYTPKYRLLS